MVDNIFENLSKVEQQALARTHSHICGDGNLYTCLQNRSPSSIRTSRSFNPFRLFIIEYNNNEPKLLKEFENDIKVLLKKETYVYKGKNRCKVRNKSLYLFLKKLEAGGSKKWKIPKIITNSVLLSKEWLRAFLDDEATVENSNGHKRIRVKSVNKNGLEQVKEMLEKLGIVTRLNGPNCDNTWYLTINDLKKYKFLIGFDHPIKLKRLLKAIEMRQGGISG